MRICFRESQRQHERTDDAGEQDHGDAGTVRERREEDEEIDRRVDPDLVENVDDDQGTLPV
jgi:hypothetical protein